MSLNFLEKSVIRPTVNFFNLISTLFPIGAQLTYNNNNFGTNTRTSSKA